VYFIFSHKGYYFSALTVLFYQFDAQSLYLIHLLHFSTCFEYYYAHLQEDNRISTVSVIVTLFGWLFST